MVKGPNKSLGQHWLKDRDVLGDIADYAELTKEDTVLEIGPGLGSLTSLLLRASKKVVAVEFDEELARKLPAQFPGTNLEVVTADILSFDLSIMPKNYAVVANVPYYITSKIIELLMTSDNKPRIAVLLVQKEVAERLAAKPGNMSILGVSAQLFAEVELGQIVKRNMFTPPPKVDSQVVILKTRTAPFLDGISEADFFRVVKAGFSAKRKKLRSSIAGGLNLSREQAEELLGSAKINPDDRAETLSLEDWLRLAKIVAT